jgi:hypothetical protein
MRKTFCTLLSVLTVIIFIACKREIPTGATEQFVLEDAKKILAEAQTNKSNDGTSSTFGITTASVNWVAAQRKETEVESFFEVPLKEKVCRGFITSILNSDVFDPSVLSVRKLVVAKRKGGDSYLAVMTVVADKTGNVDASQVYYKTTSSKLPASYCFTT